MSLATFLAIGSGGFIGAVLRAYFNGLVNKNIEHDLPFGTLSINIIGSLLMGVIFVIAHETSLIPPHIRSFIATGILGAFTTYSTFAIETLILFENKNYILGFSNMALNLFGSIVAVAIGYKLTLMLIKGA